MRKRSEEQQRLIDEYVAKVVAEAPPLTPAQRARIRDLLRPFAPEVRA